MQIRDCKAVDKVGLNESAPFYQDLTIVGLNFVVLEILPNPSQNLGRSNRGERD
jgi:hypothetical protein